jgi:multiple sugar transport system ATP-binding protein
VEAEGGTRWPLRGGAGTDGQPVALGVRPEHLTLAGGDAMSVPGEIVVVEPTGAETELLVKVGAAQVTLVTSGRPAVNPGERVGLAVEPGMAHLFDQKTGQRLAA